MADAWPPLPYDDWRDTCATLHRYTQVIGKLRLARSPFEPQWANVPLYVTARGLTTSPIPDDRRTFEVDFDLIDHRLMLRTSDGRSEELPLVPRAVADFYREVMDALGRLGLDVTITTTPAEVADPIPFPDDRTHHAYDAPSVTRFFRVLTSVDSVFREHRAPFRGRTPPVALFWGSFDLAVGRYSGHAAAPPPDAGVIERFAADAEQIYAGFSAGQATFPEAAFYAYAYPKPQGVEALPIRPDGAGWNGELGEFVLTYDAARATADPRRAILDFLESTYAVNASRLGWPEDLLQRERP